MQNVSWATLPSAEDLSHEAAVWRINALNLPVADASARVLLVDTLEELADGIVLAQLLQSAVWTAEQQSTALSLASESVKPPARHRCILHELDSMHLIDRPRHAGLRAQRAAEQLAAGDRALLAALAHVLCAAVTERSQWKAAVSGNPHAAVAHKAAANDDKSIARRLNTALPGLSVAGERGPSAAAAARGELHATLERAFPSRRPPTAWTIGNPSERSGRRAHPLRMVEASLPPIMTSLFFWSDPQWPGEGAGRSQRRQVTAEPDADPATIMSLVAAAAGAPSGWRPPRRVPPAEVVSWLHALALPFAHDEAREACPAGESESVTVDAATLDYELLSGRRRRGRSTHTEASRHASLPLLPACTTRACSAPPRARTPFSNIDRPEDVPAAFESGVLLCLLVERLRGEWLPQPSDDGVANLASWKRTPGQIAGVETRPRTLAARLANFDAALGALRRQGAPPRGDRRWTASALAAGDPDVLWSLLNYLYLTYGPTASKGQAAATASRAPSVGRHTGGRPGCAAREQRQRAKEGLGRGDARSSGRLRPAQPLPTEMHSIPPPQPPRPLQPTPPPPLSYPPSRAIGDDRPIHAAVEVTQGVLTAAEEGRIALLVEQLAGWPAGGASTTARGMAAAPGPSQQICAEATVAAAGPELLAFLRRGQQAAEASALRAIGALASRVGRSLPAPSCLAAVLESSPPLDSILQAAAQAALDAAFSDSSKASARWAPDTAGELTTLRTALHTARAVGVRPHLLFRATQRLQQMIGQPAPDVTTGLAADTTDEVLMSHDDNGPNTAMRSCGVQATNPSASLDAKIWETEGGRALVHTWLRRTFLVDVGEAAPMHPHTGSHLGASECAVLHPVADPLCNGTLLFCVATQLGTATMWRHACARRKNAGGEHGLPSTLPYRRPCAPTHSEANLYAAVDLLRRAVAAHCAVLPREELSVFRHAIPTVVAGERLPVWRLLAWLRRCNPAPAEDPSSQHPRSRPSRIARLPMAKVRAGRAGSPMHTRSVYEPLTSERSRHRGGAGSPVDEPHDRVERTGGVERMGVTRRAGAALMAQRAHKRGEGATKSMRAPERRRGRPRRSLPPSHAAVQLTVQRAHEGMSSVPSAVSEFRLMYWLRDALLIRHVPLPQSPPLSRSPSPSPTRAVASRRWRSTSPPASPRVRAASMAQRPASQPSSPYRLSIDPQRPVRHDSPIRRRPTSPPGSPSWRTSSNSTRRRRSVPVLRLPTLDQIMPAIASGELLCDVAAFVSGEPICGVFRPPRTCATALSNIRKATEKLRDAADSGAAMPSQSEIGCEAELLHGNRAAALSWLAAARRIARHRDARCRAQQPPPVPELWWSEEEEGHGADFDEQPMEQACDGAPPEQDQPPLAVHVQAVTDGRPVPAWTRHPSLETQVPSVICSKDRSAPPSPQRPSPPSPHRSAPLSPHRSAPSSPQPQHDAQRSPRQSPLRPPPSSPPSHPASKPPSPSRLPMPSRLAPPQAARLASFLPPGREAQPSSFLMLPQSLQATDSPACAPSTKRSPGALLTGAVAGAPDPLTTMAKAERRPEPFEAASSADCVALEEVLRRVRLPKLRSWLRAIGVHQEAAELTIEGSQLPAWRDGTGLVRLVEALEGRQLHGVERRPRAAAHCRRNVDKALEALRAVKTMPVTHLYSAPKLVRGEAAITLKILAEAMHAYGGARGAASVAAAARSRLSD